MLFYLSYVLMVTNAVGGVYLLRCVHNGQRPHLAGLRWFLRSLGCVPLCGITFNLIQAFELLPKELLSPLRLCVGYTLIGIAIWGFVIWLHKERRE